MILSHSHYVCGGGIHLSMERLVIVGGGIAAVSAATAARKQNPDCEIVIFSEERYLPYVRTKLSHYFHQDLAPAELQIHPKDWYESQRIDLRLGVQVSSIDSENKVVTADNDAIEYDSLILALGASSFVPSIPGTDLPGVHKLRTLEDAKEIKSALREDLRVVVVGGGILGLEAAWSLRQAKANVTIVELAPRLMPKQTDITGGEILQSTIERYGVTLYLGQAIKSIQKDGSALLAELDGNTIAADLIVFSAGIRPHTQLAKNSGIDTSRGIIVSAEMETSTPNVWACGDCAAVDGHVYGLWMAAKQQGTIAGTNAVNRAARQEFGAFTPKTMLSAFGTNLFSVGSITDETDQNGYTSIEFPTKTAQSPETEASTYRRLFLKDGHVVGGLLINAPELAGEATRLVESQATVTVGSSQ